MGFAVFLGRCRFANVRRHGTEFVALGNVCPAEMIVHPPSTGSGQAPGQPTTPAITPDRVALWLPGLFGVVAERAAASPLARRLIHSAFWTLVGSGLARVLSLTAAVCTGRLLGAEQFGELGIVQGTVGMFSVFAGLGLGLTATKHVAELRVKDPARAGRILALSGWVTAASGAFLALVLMAAAVPLAKHSLAAPHLDGLLRVGALLILLGTVSGAQQGALTGFESFKAIARVQLLTGLASFPLMLAGVWWGGLVGAVWGLVASQGVNCLLNHLALRSEARRAGVPLGWHGAGQEWRVLWSFSLPAMLCSVLIVPVNWAGLALLAHQPGGYEELGLFNAASQWRNAILFLPQALAGIVLPALASLDPARERRQYLRVFAGNVGLVGFATLALSLLVTAAAGPIMHGYGRDFANGQATLAALALGAVVMAVNQVLGADVISRGRMWPGLLCNLVWAVTFLGLAFWLVPARGAYGLALSILISYPMHSVCLLILNCRRPAALAVASPNDP